MSYKIRSLIKKLRQSNVKYSLQGCFALVRKQLMMEEALIDEDMEQIDEEIWARLNQNWPFENVI